MWVRPSKGCHTLRIVPSGSPPRRAALLAGVVVLGLLALVLALTSGGGKGSSSLAVSSSAGGGFDGAALPSPQPAPDFTLRDQSGRSVSLASLRGRPVVLAFLYPGCGRSCVLVAEQIRGRSTTSPTPCRW